MLLMHPYSISATRWGLPAGHIVSLMQGPTSIGTKVFRVVVRYLQLLGSRITKLGDNVDYGF